MEEKDWNEILGDLLGEIFSAFIILGVTGGILLLCWNYALFNLIDVNKIKFFECLLLIIGWRCLTYKKK